MKVKFQKLSNKIIKCNKCLRLVKFRKKISREKRKQYRDQTYWGKPITGFGDLNAKILFVGLAPAAHGGTRTGRAFTGDKSGDFLFKCLHSTNISNRPISVHSNDGLKLKSGYITNILKCVPPGDKPLKKELNNCSKYFLQEMSNLENLKVILTFGKVAFDNCIKIFKQNFEISNKFIFKHGKKYILPDGKILVASYHPSPRNVNTKIINLKTMKNLITKANNLY